MPKNYRSVFYWMSIILFIMLAFCFILIEILDTWEFTIETILIMGFLSIMIIVLQILIVTKRYTRQGLSIQSTHLHIIKGLIIVGILLTAGWSVQCYAGLLSNQAFSLDHNISLSDVFRLIGSLLLLICEIGLIPWIKNYH